MVNPGKDKELKAHIRAELERGIKVPDIAEQTKVPKNTIRRWKRNLERHGSMDAPPIGNAGGHKSLTSEQEHYLLGYLHGRPDAYLTEMQRILKEAFNHDVSLPTISRTLKLKGCMKGFNKTRKIRTAIDTTVQEQPNGSLGNEAIGQPVPRLSNAETSKNGPVPMDFEKNLERQLEDHLQQPLPNEVIPGTAHPAPNQDLSFDQRGHIEDSRSGTNYQEQQPISGTTEADPVQYVQMRSDQAIDPALG